MKPTRAAAAAILALPVLGMLPTQQGGQEGPIRTGDGALETGTGQEDDPFDIFEPGRGDRPRQQPGVGNGEFGDYDVFGRRSKPRANTLAERLQGGWRLVEMKLDGYTDSGRLAQGFLHIGPAFLSMEIHAGWDENIYDAGVPDEDVHTSFTAEYRLGPTGMLECTTIIGSFVDQDEGELDWERSGYERQFHVREQGKRLELVYGEGKETNTLVFQPYLPSIRGARDIFGRRVDPLAADSELDIFGRQRPKATGEVDIFGRPVPPEEKPGEGGEDGAVPPATGTPAGGGR